MSDKPKHFNRFLIALSVLTIIELLILKFALADDGILLMVSCVYLIIPFILLWIYAICFIFKRNVRNRYLIVWVVFLLLLIPVSLIIKKWYMDCNYSSAIIELPDGETLTVTSDKVIFGKCDDLKNPQKDYIDLQSECHHYSITLTQNDSLYIWTQNDSLPATTHKLRYPICKIYAGYNRMDEYSVAVDKKMKWMFKYDFIYEDPFTRGTQTLKTRKDDSLCVKTWVSYSPVHIGKREFLGCSTLKEYFKYSIPVDSLFDN